MILKLYDYTLVSTMIVSIVGLLLQDVRVDQYNDARSFKVQASQLN